MGRLRDDRGTDAGQEQELKNLRIKELITAADINAHEEQTGGVPTTENVQLPNQGSVGQIPGSSKSDYERIRDYYMQLAVIGGFDVKPKDQAYILELMEYGISIDKVLVWIKECFDEYKPRHPRDKINSFGYCLPIILDKHFAKKEVMTYDDSKRKRINEKAHDKTESITGGQVGRIRRKTV